MDPYIVVCIGIFLNRKLWANILTADITSLSQINTHSVGNGSWVIAGVTTTDVSTSGNLTAIRCSSTHLTSFAVLVDVAGGLAVSA